MDGTDIRSLTAEPAQLEHFAGGYCLRCDGTENNAEAEDVCEKVLALEPGQSVWLGGGAVPVRDAGRGHLVR